MTPVGERFASAVRRRLSPYSDLRLKDLLSELGVVHHTFVNWAEDKTPLRADAIEKADAYFVQHGLPGLLAEVMGPGTTVHAASDQMPPGDWCFWADDWGALLHAPFGHGPFVRRALDIPPEARGDLRRFAINNLGWVAVQAGMVGIALLEWNRRMVAPRAARRVAQWLQEMRVVVVTAVIDGKPSTKKAAEVFELLGLPVVDDESGEPEPWAAERLSLDRLRHSAAIDFLKASQGQPDPIDVLLQLGLADLAGMFVVTDHETLTLHVGKQIPTVDPKVIGRPLAARKNAKYARMIEQHIVEAVTEREGTLYSVRRGEDVSYRRFALAFGRVVVTLPHDIKTPDGFRLS